jgi:hypothetical protein
LREWWLRGSYRGRKFFERAAGGWLWLSKIVVRESWMRDRRMFSREWQVREEEED